MTLAVAHENPPQREARRSAEAPQERRRTGRRFKFLVNRVRLTPARKASFRSVRVSAIAAIAVEPASDPLALCANRTQRAILATLFHRTQNDWTPISRYDILDSRTQAPITPAALDQALRRLTKLGLVEARISGDIREFRLK